MITLLAPDRLSKYPARPAGGDPRMAKIAAEQMLEYLDAHKLDMVDHALFSQDPLRIIVVSELMSRHFGGERVLLDAWTVENSAWPLSNVPESCLLHPGTSLTVPRRTRTHARYKVPGQRIKAAFVEQRISGLAARMFFHHCDHLQALDPLLGLFRP